MRLIFRMVFLALLAFSLGGCLVVSPETHYAAIIRDGETNQPIPGAVVRVNYISMGLAPELHGPWHGERIADARGALDLPVADHESGPVITVAAPGYIPINELRYGQMRGLTADNLLPAQFVKLDADHLLIPLYRLPLPSVQIIVPDGYGGPLRLDLRRANALIQEKPDQRHFVFTATAGGYVRLELTPLLIATQFDAYSADHRISYRYANGAAIPQQGEVGPDAVAVRWFPDKRTDAGRVRRLAIVGTQAAYERALAAGMPADRLWDWPEQAR